MPIRAENKGKYPPNWKQIRQDILARANNCCEECGVANYAEGARDKHDQWHSDSSIHNMNSDMGYMAFGEFPHITKIVLTISHTDHDPTHNSADNLRALCQRCHLRHDKDQHQETRRRTMAVKRAERQAEQERLSPQLRMELA